MAVPARAAAHLPHHDHIVIVVEENHAASQIIGNKSALFIQRAMANGALMTQSYAVAHPESAESPGTCSPETPSA